MTHKAERLKRLSCYGMKLEDIIRRILEVDPRPLWEEEKAERKRKEEGNKRKHEHGETA
jgi:lambda repressor-like predicted transcriptional regulator